MLPAPSPYHSLLTLVSVKSVSDTLSRGVVPAEQIQADPGESVLASNLAEVNCCHCRVMNAKHLMSRACLQFTQQQHNQFLLHYARGVAEAKCILVMRVYVPACLSVSHCIPTLVHRPGCTLGE